MEQNCHLGSTLCRPYFCIIFCARFARLSKICILGVFVRTFRKRLPNYTFNITFVFHYVQEFGNENLSLIRAKARIQCKPPVRQILLSVETANRTCSSCKEQKISELQAYMKLYASGNLRILW